MQVCFERGWGKAWGRKRLREKLSPKSQLGSPRRTARLEDEFGTEQEGLHTASITPWAWVPCWIPGQRLLPYWVSWYHSPKQRTRASALIFPKFICMYSSGLVLCFLSDNTSSNPVRFHPHFAWKLHLPPLLTFVNLSWTRIGWSDRTHFSRHTHCSLFGVSPLLWEFLHSELPSYIETVLTYIWLFFFNYHLPHV